MKKFLTFISLLFVLLLALVSCASKKPAEPVIVETTKTIKEVVKDTVFTVKADSSYYKAYVDCRDGKPIITNTQAKTGLNLKAPKVNLKNGLLQVECKIDSSAVAFKYLQKYITVEKPKIVFVPKVEYKEKPFRWYHKFLMWTGGIFLFLSAVGIFLKFTVKP